MALSTEPVCIWFHTRPESLRSILSQVALYRPERLYLISDGPRQDRPQDTELCELSRQVAAESITWPCDVRKNYSDVNIGLKARITSGIDWVFQNEESAIFLEDDTIPHPTFFPYCQTLLNHYRDDERIMHIGGSNPLAGRVACPNGYLFSRYFQIWGFATWRRTWKQYDIGMTQWPMLKQENALQALYSQETMRKWITHMFDFTYDGRIQTWDVQYFFTCLFNNGLSIVPAQNLISNIGYEGAHASKATDCRNLGIPVEAIDWRNLHHPRYRVPSFEYDDLFIAENFAVKKRPPPSSWRRLINRFRDFTMLKQG